MFIGISLIVLGLIFLLKNLGILNQDVWGLLWPVLIVLIGFWIAIKKK